ncbi:PAS domain-containing sensor histidine kinase [Parasphingorhabdus halotolerans]|uniref:PAS domain-containing sensor histidine kinase n=1 Tax=Parasphingorhabdus halotolerans TaxID=2725558 RepID=UPI001B39E075|nr:PAS domain-containing sensor histidine kinase [Parasphingorhabdus halotolerans]
MGDNISINTDRQAYLEAVLATLPECVAIIDRNFRLIDMNQAGLAKVGVSRFEDLPDGAPLTIISEQCRPVYEEAFRAILIGKKDAIGKPFRIELESVDGIMRLMECRFAPLHDDKGNVDSVVVTSRDISEWQKDLAASERSGSILQSILATVPAGMVVIDEQGLITSFSATAQALFGYSETELLGQNVKILMPAPHHDRHDDYIKHYLQTGEQHIIGIGRKVEGRRKDGTIFPMQLEVGEARIGEECLFTGFIVDLTEQTRTAAEMQALQAELIHASRLSAVGTLASALAHEINQPLTAISNYLSAARDMVAEGSEIDQDMLTEALRESVSESLRAGTIVRRLREFVAKGEINRQALSIAQLVEDATTLGLVGAHDKGVEWAIDIAPDTNHVFVDRVQIQQVMVNLMRNAIEAMAESPVKHLGITVRSVDENQVEILVSDTGCGIDPEVGDKIFNPFASTKGDGMGLGLSICRTIIEAHDGKISVESNPDGGSIFRVSLLKAKKEQTDDE